MGSPLQLKQGLPLCYVAPEHTDEHVLLIPLAPSVGADLDGVVRQQAQGGHQRLHMKRRLNGVGRVRDLVGQGVSRKRKPLHGVRAQDGLGGVVGVAHG